MIDRQYPTVFRRASTLVQEFIVKDAGRESYVFGFLGHVFFLRIFGPSNASLA
jgi:hypothetical protein